MRGRGTLQQGRWDAFDGLRTLLVIGVMAHHAEWTVGVVDARFVAGWLPVDGFFVLSGFLITGNLLRELDSTGRIDVRRFWLRRLARLYPALLALLAALWVMAAFFDRHSWSNTWPTLVSAATYSHNLAGVYDWFSPILPETGPLWSLSIEFQFYLALPLLLGALAAVRAPRAVWIGLVAAVAIASAIWRARLGFAGFPRTYLFTPLRLDSLSWGVLIALCWRRLAVLPAAALRLFAAGGAGVLVWLYLTASAFQDSTYRWGIAAAGVASAAVIVWLLHSPGSLASRALSWGPLVALGRRSYAAYLWHQMVLFFLLDHTGLSNTGIVIGGFVATWLIADLSYRWVERPVLDGLATRRGLRRRSGASMVHYITREPIK